MEKSEMAVRTMEGFVRALEKDGHLKYASELRAIVAMSRRRRESTAALSNMATTLLVHIIKYIAIPQSRDRNKWRTEIKGRLSEFNIHNISFKNKPWLSVAFIEKELNEFLSNPRFLKHLTLQLEGYSNKDKKSALSLAESGNLKSLNVKLFFDSENNLKISINNQEF